MTEEMHIGMEKLIDTVRPVDLEEWLEEIYVFDAKGDMPWLIDSETHIATLVNGQVVVLDKRKFH